MLGKEVRLQKILNQYSGKMLLVPIDHGMSDGPIKGLEDVKKTISLVSGNADAIIMHKGLVSSSIGRMKDSSLIIHLSAGTSVSPDPLEKVIVTSVEEAVSLGADAVSVHINVGANSTTKMLKDVGRISRDCKRFGMPLIVMSYPRGEKIIDEKNVEVVKLAARVGAELGADIIKTNYTGSKESFKQVVDGCPVPIVIAGGCKGTDKQVLQMIRDAMDAGAAGVAMGRNAFQHKEPKKIIYAVSLILHNNYSVEQAIKEAQLNEETLTERVSAKSMH